MTFYCFDSRLNPLDVGENWPQQRSFLYGDGHFTTIKVKSGVPCFLDAHLARLQNAQCKLLMGELAWPALARQIRDLANQKQEGFIRVHISRGQGGRGYGGLSTMSPNVFISSGEFDDSKLPVQMALGIAETRLGKNRQLAGLKHNNRLEQVLIAAELERKGWQDALVMDEGDRLIETSKANVFWFDGDAWYSPALEFSGIAGIMRSQVLAHNPDVKLVQEPLEKVLANCQSMLVCNSLIQVRAVGKVALRTLETQLSRPLDLTFL